MSTYIIHIICRHLLAYCPFHPVGGMIFSSQVAVLTKAALGELSLESPSLGLRVKLRTMILMAVENAMLAAGVW